jgi:hypothetical protein
MKNSNVHAAEEESFSHTRTNSRTRGSRHQTEISWHLATVSAVGTRISSRNDVAGLNRTIGWPIIEAS